MTKLLLPLLALLVAAPPLFAGEKPDFPPWSEFGKDTQATEGFWSFHQDKKKRDFWIEIPRSNKPFLLATSISGGTTMAGWQWNDWLLVFEQQDKKLVLLERNVGFRGTKAGTLKEAVERTYTDRVLATYPIRSKGPKGGFVIDGRAFFASGAGLFFGGIGRSMDASLAKFDGSKGFEGNTEIRVTMPGRKGQLITLHYSISGLPNGGYKPREADTRLGYFTTILKDFAAENDDDQRKVRYVNRWNLKKLDKKLELSPPKKPIVFYVEKTVPIWLRRYVRDGILEWNKAFEKVGFDEAIRVIQQTKDNEHRDKDPEDVRYNFFRWIVSDRAFAMGPSRVNPMTGEILDADIIFDDAYVRFTLREYQMTIRELPTALVGPRDRAMAKVYDFGRLGLVPARDEFLDAIPDDAARPALSPHLRRAFCSHGAGIAHQLGCSSLALRAVDADGKGELPVELIGEFVKDTVMHEVGHTLGLRHNFKASTYRTFDEINSDAKPGDIAASVMDYNPLVIAPDGKPQGNYAMRTIGPYDYWAIAYGYTEDEKELPKILARVAEKGLDYATDEDTYSNDPLVNRWDLGTDPLAYARERLQLMRRLRKNLEERAVEKGKTYNRLRRAMNMQLFEARRAGRLAVRFVGGEHVHRDQRGDPNAREPLVPVAAARQREALQFLCKELFSGAYFEFEPELLRKLAPDFWRDDFFSFLLETHEYPYLDNVLRVQFGLVYALTSPDRLARVVGTREKTAAGEDVLTVPDIFDALHATIFGDLAQVVARKSSNQMPALNTMQRNLQREYVAHLIYILLKGEGYYSAPVQTLARHYVKELARGIKKALDGADGLDTYTRSHLEECQAKLERALEASYVVR